MAPRCRRARETRAACRRPAPAVPPAALGPAVPTGSMGLAPAAEHPDSLACGSDAVQSRRSRPAEPGREARSTRVPAGRDPSNAALGNLCAARRLFPLLGAVGLLAGTAAGAWLLVKHLKQPLADPGSAPPQEPGAVAACGEGDEEEPVVPRAPGAASFRINSGNSLLEVQVESRPGWLLACHERWDLSLGTRLCRQLGSLRMTHQKAVNVTDVRVEGAQQFAQITAERGSRLRDMWQVRSRCESGRIVALQCSECGQRPGAARVLGGADAPRGRWPWQVSVQHGSQHRCGGSVLAPDWIVTAAHCVHSYRRRRRQVSGWLVFAGVITHGSVGQEAGVPVEKIIYHSLYDDKSLDYDIALMKLKVPLNFSDAVGAVCLPPSRQDLLHGTRCWVSGWGYTSPDQGHGDAEGSSRPLDRHPALQQLVHVRGRAQRQDALRRLPARAGRRLPGRQRGPLGLPGRIHVALGRHRELGPGLRGAQPPGRLHQRGSAAALDLPGHGDVLEAKQGETSKSKNLPSPRSE
ncbi:transmembrane protease serine 5 isoform X1 [Dromaius novaehollandiae]|uniref:transmembrane protease serine 5 isoform X1 n=1 Tax=Dromaius novaehollandiae TaxID=8790 RepID=UPI003120429D